MFYRRLTTNRSEFGLEVTDALRTSKIVHVVDVPKEIDHRRFYEQISDAVGESMPTDENAASGVMTTERWSDVRYDPKLQQYFRYSNTPQPLHTDSSYVSDPPDITFFYCVSQAGHGGETTFLDAFDLLYWLNKLAPSLLDRLHTTPMQLAKGDDCRVTKMITYDQQGPLLTWNYYRARSDADSKLVEDFHQFLQHEIVAQKRTLDLRLEPGEAVFFHDLRLLHGRRAFEIAEGEERLFWKGGIRLSATQSTS